MTDLISHSFGLLVTLFLAWAFGHIALIFPALSGLLLTILVILLLELTWSITKMLGYTV